MAARRHKTMREYEDAFESIMEYTESKIGRRTIKTKAQLRGAILEADARRKNQQEKPKITQRLLDIFLSDDFLKRPRPRNNPYLNAEIGMEAPVLTLNPRYIERSEPRIAKLRSEGKTIYAYDEGVAYRATITNRGIERPVFRDVVTQRFVSKAAIESR